MEGLAEKGMGNVKRTGEIIIEAAPPPLIPKNPQGQPIPPKSPVTGAK